MSDRLAELERAIEQRDYHLAEIERRIANMVRVGTVHSVDAAKGTLRVRIGTDPEGQPVLSPALPWSERAGAIKTWSPPGVGETVRIVSPSGEIAQGWVDPGGFSSVNPAPSAEAGEHVVTIGDTRLSFKADAVTITRGGAVIRMTPDGKIVLDGPVEMPKGFTAGEGGEGEAGRIRGKLHAEQEIRSETKVAAPIFEGTLA